MKPLKDQKILILRGQAGALQTGLEAEGAKVYHTPVFQLLDPPSWDAFDQAALVQKQFSYLIFTSIEAVKKTFLRLNALKITLPKKITIVSVGNQTAKAIEAHGYNCDIIPDQFQAEGLISVFKNIDLNHKQIWFPRALVARDELLQFLQDKGATVALTPVYENKIALESKSKIQDLISQNNLNWLCFTSSSSVQNFFTLLDNKTRNLPKAASIGLVTSEELKKYNYTATVTANPQNIKGLVEAIINYEKN